MLHQVRSSSVLRSALASSLTLAAMLATLAVPAAASGSTRWVDDDGHAGSSSCSGTRTASTSIQKAINAAGTGDVIKVCPGTYTGRLSISGARDGLTLVSVSSYGAQIKAPSGTGSTIPMVTIDHVDDVTVTGFALRSRTSGSCRTWIGISASHARYVSIDSNDIRPTGTHTDQCGIWHGIVARSGTTGNITDNVLKDFRADGISVRGAGTRVIVQDNDLRFYHLNAQYVSQAQGIALLSGGSAKVTENRVTSPATAGQTTPWLGAAIHLDAPGLGTDIRFNTTHHIANGIRAFHGSKVQIRDNSFVEGQIGMLLQDLDDSSINGNYVTANGYGIYVQSASRANTISSNDFRYNVSTDCTDDSSGSGTANTANTWTLDKGNTDIHPTGICK